MESRGTRGRVHVSQETANLLIKQGKEHWVTPRTDKVLAKGKVRYLRALFVTLARYRICEES
jgi:hypothetical protein